MFARQHSTYSHTQLAKIPKSDLEPADDWDCMSRPVPGHVLDPPARDSRPCWRGRATVALGPRFAFRTGESLEFILGAFLVDSGIYSGRVG